MLINLLMRLAPAQKLFAASWELIGLINPNSQQTVMTSSQLTLSSFNAVLNGCWAPLG